MRWRRSRDPDPLLTLDNLAHITERCPHCHAEGSKDSVCFYDARTDTDLTYEFICADCSRIFTITLPIAEWERRKRAHIATIMRTIVGYIADPDDRARLTRIFSPVLRQCPTPP